MDEGNKRAALVAKIIDDSGKLLSAVLIGNNGGPHGELLRLCAVGQAAAEL